MSGPPPIRPIAPVPQEPIVLNARRTPFFTDLYHAALRMSWTSALGLLGLGWWVTNLLFAVAFLEVGGVEEARPGSMVDAFDFSVQTFGTIGYGVMHPQSASANLLVDLESCVSLALTALATGLVFARFSRSPPRIRFGRHATIAPMNGVPTLTIRVGNERGNRIVDARIRVVLFRTEHLLEGTTFYRMLDLRLTRDWTPALSRSLSVLHPIEPDSPLHGLGPEEARAQEIELVVVVTGTDDTTMAPIHALEWYAEDRLCFGFRHADILSEAPDGRLVLDVARFDELLPVSPSPEAS